MPSIVAQDLFRRSLLLIGAIGQSDDPDPGMYNDVMTTFNELLDNWSTETMSVFSTDQAVFPLQAGKDTYTWGLGGDMDSERPIYVTDANFTYGGVTLPIRIMPPDIFNSNPIAVSSGQVVRQITYINDMPYCILKVFPTPSMDSDGLKINVQKVLTRVTSLTQVITMPEGYQRALRYALGVDLWPEYPNPQVDISTIKQIATNSKADIQRANSNGNEMSFSDVPGHSDRSSFIDWRMG